jgi:hypothetical protein
VVLMNAFEREFPECGAIRHADILPITRLD